MTTKIIIPASEYGIVRVFQLSEPLARRVAGEAGLFALAQALGAKTLNTDHVQVTALRSLDDLGLAGLLEQGHGVAPDTLGPDAHRLAALSGTVAILRSRAFDGAALTLTPGEDCILVAAYAEDGAPPPRLEPLHSAGAAGVLDGGPAGGENDHRASRRTLLIGLAIALMLALLVLALGGATP